MLVAEAYESVLAALCLWREARGEPREAKRGVLWVIRNRAQDARARWPSHPIDVILQRAQFSSFTLGDPNAVKFPRPDDPSWLECCAVVDDPGEDPTGGANHYHSLSAPDAVWWAQGETPIAHLGHLWFYGL